MTVHFVDLILETLKPVLQSHGFEYSGKDGIFIRALEGVSHFFYLRFLKSQGGYEVEPGAGIRIDVVETIFHKVSGVPLEDQRDSASIGIALHRLSGNRAPRVLWLTAPADVTPAANGLIRVFEDHALPYYEKCSTVEAVDVLLNDEAWENSPHTVLEWNRAAIGLIAAKLSGRRNFDELVGVYREKLGRISRGFYLARFEKLVTILEEF